MTDTPNQPTGTAAEILRRHHHLPTEQDIHNSYEGIKTDVLDTASTAHQLYEAELERIDAAASNDPDAMYAELREKARLFYGQLPQTLEQLAKGTPFEGLIKGDSIK